MVRLNLRMFWQQQQSVPVGPDGGCGQRRCKIHGKVNSYAELSFFPYRDLSYYYLDPVIHLQEVIRSFARKLITTE